MSRKKKDKGIWWLPYVWGLLFVGCWWLTESFLMGVYYFVIIFCVYAAILLLYEDTFSERARQRARRIELDKTKRHMLFVMQWGHTGGIAGTLEEFNNIFKQNPDWELHKWEVFRAWYKHEIDDMTKYPNIYHFNMRDGSVYSKEKDPLYDPEAPDWALFDRDHDYDSKYYDDDDDDDDYNDDDYGEKTDEDWGEVVKKGIYTGIGIGIGNSIVGGNAFGGGN